MSKKIKMILVEDNEDERMFMKEGFTATGLYDIVAEASNGNEMLALFQKQSLSRPELVISDLNMPGKNGYDVIQDIKRDASWSDVPVVIVTTAPYSPFAQRCKELGACAYYTKPDTFLEYQSFAANIYNDITTRCLKK
ncbi:MAG TPA: response regulator [Flavisolibacter sp.]|nr:response regulator [Flavisolibacter sp.]